MAIRDQKAVMREELRRARVGIAQAFGEAAAIALAAHMPAAIRKGKLSGPVSAYWPGAGEMDSRLLLQALAGEGFLCALPVVTGKGEPLIFRRWQPGDTLISDRYGLENPTEDKESLEPGIVLAPLVAFDAAGNRLGQGGGFYDRTIAALRKKGNVTVIGLAFAGQEVDRVPVDVYDEPLDAIATEVGIRWFKKDSA